MGNEGVRGGCGRCFETAYLAVRLVPCEGLSCRSAQFQEGRYLGPELVNL